jgi:hypothetical protein
VIAFLFWPSDFSPGVPQVFMLNGFFVLMFTSAGPAVPPRGAPFDRPQRGSGGVSR